MASIASVLFLFQIKSNPNVSQQMTNRFIKTFFLFYEVD